MGQVVGDGVQQVVALARGLEDRGPVAVRVDARALGRDDERQHVPAAVRGDAPFEAGTTVQPLEHRQVGIELLVVAVDPRVGGAREHLVVARVREPQPVRDPHAALAGRVAEDLALARDDGPEERQERLAPRLRRRAVEARLERLLCRDGDAAVVLGVERALVAAEELLPAEAVEGHDQHVVDGRGRSRTFGASSTSEGHDGDEQQEPAAPLHASLSSFISAVLRTFPVASSRARAGSTSSRFVARPTSSR